MKSIWNGEILAQSNETKVVENNYYFPKDSVNMEYFRPSSTHTRCFWKGEASYSTIEVNGKLNEDAAWYYPHASKAAKAIEDHVAFWKGVEITD